MRTMILFELLASTMFKGVLSFLEKLTRTSAPGGLLDICNPSEAATWGVVLSGLGASAAVVSTRGFLTTGLGVLGTAARGSTAGGGGVSAMAGGGTGVSAAGSTGPGPGSGVASGAG